MPIDGPIIIKKSPIVLIKNLVILQLIATTAYFIAGILGNYSALYQEFSLTHFLSYEVAKFLFIISAEFFLIGLIFLRWFFESYTVFPSAVAHEWGIWWKRKKTIPLHAPISASIDYTILMSRIFKYGTLIIQDRALRKPVRIPHVPTPEQYEKMVIAQQAEAARAEAGNEQKDINDLLREREHERLEFKTSFRWDGENGNVNRALEKAVMKTIVAFLNSDGGHLVVGVGDDGRVAGINADYVTLRRKDADGFENHFTNVFNDIVGPEFRRFVKLSFDRVDDKEVCMIRVMPSVKPAYMKFENEENFYIRTGNSTTALPVSEVAPYIQSRWREG